MTVLLTTTLVTAVVFAALMAVRRGALNRVQPIQAILRLRQRRPGKPAAKAPVRKSGKGGQFHAVTIKLDPSPCHAVKVLHGHALLSRDVPILPLAECDQAACKCRYVHHDDRRHKSRRGYMSDLAHVAAVGSNEERREKITGRRDSDWTGFE